MTKKDLNDTRYIYTLLRFIKLIKLYIESKTEHKTTEEYVYRNCTTKIDYAANPHLNKN